MSNPQDLSQLAKQLEEIKKLLQEKQVLNQAVQSSPKSFPGRGFAVVGLSVLAGIGISWLCFVSLFRFPF
jgi:hypothetical protein